MIISQTNIPEEIYETFRQDQENEDLARIKGEVKEQVQLLLNF